MPSTAWMFGELMESAGVYIDDSAKLPLPTPDGRLQIHPEFLDNASRRDERQRDRLRFGRRSAVEDRRGWRAAPAPQCR